MESPDMPRITPVTGSLTATGSSNPCGPTGWFNVTLSGTFVGTVLVERSFDLGATYHPVSTREKAALSFTAPVSLSVFEPEDGVLHRVRCSAYTSGTITYRISQ